jgi:predicted ATPase
MLIEEPESHLHPGAHGALADLIVDVIHAESLRAAIVETHSEVFCLRVQRRIAEGTLRPDDVVIYWVDDGAEGTEDTRHTTIKRIDIDAQGTPSYWPKGVFSEDFAESKAILKAKQRGADKTPDTDGR